jgi:hypothetical protein
LPADSLFHIAQEGKGKAELLRKSSVRRGHVDADCKNLSSRPLEFGKSILVCLEFLRSAWSVCINKKGQDDTVLPSEITEPDEVA